MALIGKRKKIHSRDPRERTTTTIAFGILILSEPRSDASLLTLRSEDRARSNMYNLLLLYTNYSRSQELEKKDKCVREKSRERET